MKIPLTLLNSMPREAVMEGLRLCCGASLWVNKLEAARPFTSLLDLFEKSEKIWWSLSEKDWLEAFRHHPKIGDVENLRKKFASTADWAQQEQKSTALASDSVLKALARSNEEYENRFGYIFIVCATGKSAEEMLHLLSQRLKNEPGAELRNAAAEQAKITRLRLEKWIDEKA